MDGVVVFGVVIAAIDLDNESLSFMELLNKGGGGDGHGIPPHFRYLIYFVLRTVFDWKDIKLCTLAKVKYTLASVT